MNGRTSRIANWGEFRNRKNGCFGEDQTRERASKASLRSAIGGHNLRLAYFPSSDQWVFVCQGFHAAIGGISLVGICIFLGDMIVGGGIIVGGMLAGEMIVNRLTNGVAKCNLRLPNIIGPRLPNVTRPYNDTHVNTNATHDVPC